MSPIIDLITYIDTSLVMFTQINKYSLQKVWCEFLVFFRTFVHKYAAADF